MKIIDVQLVTLAMVVLLVGVQARPENEVDAWSASLNEPATGGASLAAEGGQYAGSALERERPKSNSHASWTSTERIPYAFKGQALGYSPRWLDQARLDIGSNRKKRSDSSSCDASVNGLIACLEMAVGDILQPLVDVLMNVTSNLGSDPVNAIRTLLEDLEKSPLNKILTNIPIIGSILQQVESILQIPISVILNVLNAVIDVLQSVTGSLLGMSTSTTSAAPGLTTLSS